MQALQSRGYVTGALGKVHFNHHFESLHPDYKPYGFDVTYITEDGRRGEWNDWVRTSQPQHYDDVLATVWPTEIPDDADYGEYHLDLRSRIKRIREGFKWASTKYPQNTDWVYTLPFPEEVSQTNWITMNGLDLIRQASTTIVKLEDVSPTVLEMVRAALPEMPKMGSYLPVSSSEIQQLPGESLLPLEPLILQDYPKTRRELFALGVH